MTISGDDLGRSICFYPAGLGLSTAGIIRAEVEQGTMTCFDVEAGFKLDFGHGSVRRTTQALAPANISFSGATASGGALGSSG